jgi:hypothetical protein
VSVLVIGTVRGADRIEPLELMGEFVILAAADSALPHHLCPHR